ncbi:NAD(P)H-binding protein [Erwinia sp. CPCC 100877]|nr:NAD(P)H-binding protein [Erwinia sp. CPCC 100877]
MRVLVIGANGQIGRILVNKLQELKNFTPVAMVRNPEQAAAFQSQGVEAVLGDLEGTIDDMAKLFVDENADAIVFTAGSGGKTGADKTMLIDLDGAVKSVKAAEQAGIKRYIMVSAFGVNHWHDNEVPAGVKQLSYYSAAKYYADLFVAHSSLDYTIIRPTALTNEAGVNRIAVSEQTVQKTISRADVAQTIVAVLSEDKTIGQSFPLSSGPVAIEQAISSVNENN